MRPEDFNNPNIIQTKEYMRKLKKEITQGSPDENEAAQLMRIKMQNVFFYHEDGPDVLAEILFQLRYNQELNTPTDVALYNAAIGLLNALGVAQHGEIRKYIDTWISTRS